MPKRKSKKEDKKITLVVRVDTKSRKSRKSRKPRAKKAPPAFMPYGALSSGIFYHGGAPTIPQQPAPQTAQSQAPSLGDNIGYGQRPALTDKPSQPVYVLDYSESQKEESLAQPETPQLTAPVEFPRLMYSATGYGVEEPPTPKASPKTVPARSRETSPLFDIDENIRSFPSEQEQSPARIGGMAPRASAFMPVAESSMANIRGTSPPREVTIETVEEEEAPVVKAPAKSKGGRPPKEDAKQGSIGKTYIDAFIAENPQYKGNPKGAKEAMFELVRQSNPYRSDSGDFTKRWLYQHFREVKESTAQKRAEQKKARETAI